MTENEAILIMDGATREDYLYMYDAEDRPYLIARAENMALNALKEMQKCRAIGSMEELKALKEKSEPKKVINYDKHYYKCPTCNEDIGVDNDSLYIYGEEPPRYCMKCGQRIVCK